MGFSFSSMIGTYININASWAEAYDRGAYFLDYNFVSVVLVVLALRCKVITPVAKKLEGLYY
jgi:hypothetical protein